MNWLSNMGNLCSKWWLFPVLQCLPSQTDMCNAYLLYSLLRFYSLLILRTLKGASVQKHKREDIIAI